ncbi:hypothetical protein JNUCC1_02822 [Lentibacillus sp. JNUCC-1]|uniref:hypothetical protein n=1 Tax=Lentibacillus sp. JNUCC-1 TaxID=2654513 RepID=UPI0012E71C61|nr:hypothetical protein [Lentibacillus sp. JNUCC-1]MUV38950.1 hypothetical protein [Lentibacillus sp. JNUCC-1]
MSSPEISNGSVTNGKANASLILGVISIVLAIVPLGGMILGIIGLIIGVIGLREVKGLKQRSRKIALSGIVCSS